MSWAVDCRFCLWLGHLEVNSEMSGTHLPATEIHHLYRYHDCPIWSLFLQFIFTLMPEAGVEFGGVIVSLRAGLAFRDNVNFRTLISNLVACFRCFRKISFWVMSALDAAHFSAQENLTESGQWNLLIPESTHPSPDQRASCQAVVKLPTSGSRWATVELCQHLLPRPCMAWEYTFD